MKRLLCLLLVFMFLLVGCGNTEKEHVPDQTLPQVEAGENSQTEAPTLVTEIQPEKTEPAPTETSVTEPAPTEPVVTVPVHSALYLEGVCVEDVILWFHEVVLDSEFINGGDPSRLQRWEDPICYSIEGEPTQEDLAVLESFCVWLNTVEGFPGIRQASAGDWVNLRIHFTDAQGLLAVMGSGFDGLDGAVTFWYDGFDRIYEEVICIRTDLDQTLRNSVLLEEIYNGLGPMQDTNLRPDSIIYQEFTQPQALTAVDELLLKLLYHPDMACGMNAAECEAVIRQLYY